MGWLLAGGRGQGGNLLPGADLLAVTCRRRPARGLHRASRKLLAGGLWGSSRGDPRRLRPGMLPMASARGLFCLGRACGDGGLFSRSSLQRASTSSTSQVRLLASRGWLRPPLLPSCGTSFRFESGLVRPSLFVFASEVIRGALPDRRPNSRGMPVVGNYCGGWRMMCGPRFEMCGPRFEMCGPRFSAWRWPCKLQGELCAAPDLM
jgi:hypothetical protein